MIEGHGDDAWQYKTKIRANFSSNVYYGPLDAGLRTHLQDSLASVTHYPEAGANSLQEAAAMAFEVGKMEVLVTNGATEAIYLVAQAFRQLKTVTIFTPGFSEYADACKLHDWQIQYQPWEFLFLENRMESGLVFLCNPNNPTGYTLSADRITKLLKANLQTIFILDESYIHFTDRTQSMVGLLKEHTNLLILRSMTKDCRIPGIRLGFALGHRSLLDQLRNAKMPWSVNQFAMEAGLYIFRHAQDFVIPLKALLEETAVWRSNLKTATGWKVHETQTHYFLMETPKEKTAAALKFLLIERYGLLIRDAANFKGLSPCHFRVACQSPADNQLLTEALRQCSQNGF